MINLISDYFFNNYDEDATEYWNGTCSKLGSAVAVGWVDPELANNELKKMHTKQSRRERRNALNSSNELFL